MIKVYNQIDVAKDLLKKTCNQVLEFSREQDSGPYSQINVAGLKKMLHRLEAIEQYAKCLRSLIQTVNYIDD